MSHVVQIKTQVRDPAAVSVACGRLGLAQPAMEDVKLFSVQVHGLAVRLDGWRYLLRWPVWTLGHRRRERGRWSVSAGPKLPEGFAATC